MTYRELLEKLETAQCHDDDPVELVRPVVGRPHDRFEIVDVLSDGYTVQFVLARSN